MEKYYALLVFIFTTLIGKAQSITFTDANFKADLIAATSNTGRARDAQGNNISIDANGNNEIEVSEALALDYLMVNPSSITDVTGLEYFSNLTYFYCAFNHITDLSVVSNLPNLKSLYCNNNLLASLNLNPNIAIENIYCNNNQLTALDISNCINLKRIYCTNNTLSILATANLPNLLYLDCSNNALTAINVSNDNHLSELRCSYNAITTLDLTDAGEQYMSGPAIILDCRNNNLLILDTSVMGQGVKLRITCASNPNLTSIYAKNGVVFMDDSPPSPPFPGLYIVSLPNLHYICVDDFNLEYIQNKVDSLGYSDCIVDSLCTLSNSVFDLDDNFAVYPNPSSGILNIENNGLMKVKSIAIYNTLGEKVISDMNAAISIDTTVLKTGTYFVTIETDKGIAHSKFIKE